MVTLCLEISRLYPFQWVRIQCQAITRVYHPWTRAYLWIYYAIDAYIRQILHQIEADSDM